MGLFHGDLEEGLLQCSSLLLREAAITSIDKVMIEGGVGALWRTDGHDGEVQVVDGAGGDRGGHRGLLPLLVRLADQQSGSQETKADHHSPEDFEGPGLKGKFKNEPRTQGNADSNHNSHSPLMLIHEIIHVLWTTPKIPEGRPLREGFAHPLNRLDSKSPV